MPEPPKETMPHPYGVDVELLQRLIQSPNSPTCPVSSGTFSPSRRNHRAKFLEFAGIAPNKNPKKLSHEEIVRLMQNLKKYKDFLPPDANCLSPLGEELLKAGVMKELSPRIPRGASRKPSTYAGHPFIVEMAMAYGGGVPKRGNFVIYRFANKIRCSMMKQATFLTASFQL